MYKRQIPVSTTPGKVVPFELVGAVPAECDALTIEIMGEEGGVRQRYRSSSNGPADTLLMPPVEPRSVHIVVVGDESSAPEFAYGAFKDETVIKPVSGDQPDAPLHTLWDDTAASLIAPARLPMSWIAYDGCDVVIAKADDLARADARSIAALLTWVDAGGRLLLLVDQAGSVWMNFITSDPLPITCAEAGRHAPSSGLRELTMSEHIDPLTFDPRLSLSSRAVPSSYEIPGRPISITPAGRRSAWKVLWMTDADETAQSEEAGGVGTSDGAVQSGLFATGPQGAGMIGVLGVDPSRLTEAPDAAAAQRLYRFAAAKLLPSHVLEVDRAQHLNQWMMREFRIGTRDYAAVDKATNAVTTAPVVGFGVFLSITALLAMLAAMLGLYDGLIGRKRIHAGRTWLTALLWIGLTSVAAYVAPMLLRSGETQVNRLTFVDSICDADGTASEGWKTSVLAIFGAYPASAALSPQMSAVDGAWWRGISSISFSDKVGKPFSELNVPITAGRSGLREGKPLTISQGQWTYRLLVENTPRVALDSPLRVVAQRDRAFELAVAIKGIPKGATVVNSLLETRGKVYDLQGHLGTLNEDGVLEGPPMRIVQTQLHAKATTDTQTYGVKVTNWTTPDENIAESFPVSCNRSDVMTRCMAEGGSYGVLYLHLRAKPLSPLLLGIEPVIEREETRYRMLVRLPVCSLSQTAETVPTSITPESSPLSAPPIIPSAEPPQ